MKITQNDNGSYELHCKAAEFAILCAALNNIEQQVDPQEYTTLMGATADQIDAVRTAMFAARG